MTDSVHRLAWLHYRMGNALLFIGWPGGALQAYRDAIRSAPGFADAHFRLGEALARLGRWRDASAAFREAARLDPASAEAHGNLVLALGRSGQPGAAAAALQGLIRARPNEPEPHLLRGALLLRLGRRSEAIAALRWAACLPAPRESRRFFLGEALLGAERWRDVAGSLAAARACVSGSRLPSVATASLNRPPAALASVRSAPRAARRRSLAGPVAALVRRAGIESVRARAALRRAARRVLGETHLLFGLALAGRSPHRAIRSLRQGIRLTTAT